MLTVKLKTKKELSKSLSTFSSGLTQSVSTVGMSGNFVAVELKDSPVIVNISHYVHANAEYR